MLWDQQLPYFITVQLYSLYSYHSELTAMTEVSATFRSQFVDLIASTLDSITDK